jgi:hypothetical protein
MGANRLTFVALAWLAVCMSPVAQALSCSGSGPKPEWVERPETTTEQHLFAAGVSADARASLSERIASARQDALKNLSGMIEVTVKNALVLEQSSRRVFGSEFSDSNVSSVTQTSTSASLRNVEIVETWEDPNTCDLWLRARVSRAEVEKARREGMSRVLFGVLQQQLALAQREEAMPEQRLEAVAAAQDVLPRIVLTAVPEAGTSAYYEQLLSRLRAELEQARAARARARDELQAADQLVAEAAAQSNATERAQRLTRAAAIYRALLVRHADGLPGLFASGDLLFRLGGIEEARDSACGARNYYQQAQDAPQLNDRRELARSKAAALVCSPQDLERTRWRQFFEGRSLTLVCYYRAGKEVTVWLKACDGLNDIVRSLGAAVTVRSQRLSAAQLQAFLQGELPQDMDAPPGMLLVAAASGSMVRRADSDPQGRGSEYQFDGSMASLLLEDGKLVFSDRFKGTTGWNPVSPEMVMDVLAINVVKRWQGKFSKFLGGN